MAIHADIGLPQFLVVACYIVIFCFLWRTLSMVFRRQGWTNLSGAMAAII
jgi:multisubunit Na+/H+ antiporter MnhB subunit